MNGKKAKKLRRIAAQVTAGQPYASYRWETPRVRTIVLNKGCMRQIYKSFKAAAKGLALNDVYS